MAARGTDSRNDGSCRAVWGQGVILVLLLRKAAREQVISPLGELALKCFLASWQQEQTPSDNITDADERVIGCFGVQLLVPRDRCPFAMDRSSTEVFPSSHASRHDGCYLPNVAGSNVDLSSPYRSRCPGDSFSKRWIPTSRNQCPNLLSGATDPQPWYQTDCPTCRQNQ